MNLNISAMTILPPFNFMKWIEDNRHLLKPPVGNQLVYEDSEFMVMVVGGPNARKDFHFNKGEELYYQIIGDIKLPIRIDGRTEVIEIKEGDMFLLPPGVEHSPQRFKDTVGLVIERQRADDEMDACTWYCENCDTELHRAEFHCSDIVGQLKVLLNKFYASEEMRTCKNCGTVMQVPQLPEA
jgi:3-hydroxyanthranilate 3,4-dioxygenase